MNVITLATETNNGTKILGSFESHLRTLTQAVKFVRDEMPNITLRKNDRWQEHFELHNRTYDEFVVFVKS